MTPEELARSKVASAADPDARRAQATAAEQLGVTLFQRDGIVTRAELKAAGLTRSDIDRLLRHNSLRRVHRLVYVDHTGPLTRDQRIWAAVLALAPAVVCGRTLLFPEAGTDADPVDIAIDWRRRVTVPAGVRLHRVRGLEALVLHVEAHRLAVGTNEGEQRLAGNRFHRTGAVLKNLYRPLLRDVRIGRQDCLLL